MPRTTKKILCYTAITSILNSSFLPAYAGKSDLPFVSEEISYTQKVYHHLTKKTLYKERVSNPDLEDSQTNSSRTSQTVEADVLDVASWFILPPLKTMIGAVSLVKQGVRFVLENPGKAITMSLLLQARTAASALELSSLTLLQGFNISGTSANDYSGYSVSSAGDFNGDGLGDIIIGAYHANSYAGKSYVIYGTNSTPLSISLSALTPLQGFTINGAAANDQSGYSVSSAGDFNSDGFDDVIVGADIRNSYIIYGTNSTPSSISLSSLTPSQGFTINGAFDHSGGFVSAAGDFNGDGFDDVIIGVHSANSYAGKSYVIYGTNSTPSSISLNSLTPLQGITINGTTANDYSGHSVSSAGDFNGDGLNEVIIGAYGVNTGAGKSYVIYGTNSTPSSISLSSLTPLQGFAISGAAAYDFSGYSVSSAGDFNGDGLGDIIIGAPNTADKSYVIYGTNSTPSSISLSSLTSLQGFTISGVDSLGWSASSAGDFNGDGFNDVVIGAPGYISIAGKSYVVYGTNSTPSSIGLSSLTSPQGFTISGIVGDYSGWSVSSAGDFNGDGLDDIIIGAHRANNYTGNSYIIYGVRSPSPTNSNTMTSTGASTATPMSQVTSALTQFSTNTGSLSTSISSTDVSTLSSNPSSASTQSSSETPVSWKIAAAVGGGIGAVVIVGIGGVVAKKCCFSKKDKPVSNKTDDSDVELVEDNPETSISKNIGASASSSRVVSPFEAKSAGFTEHPTFVGAIHGNSYAIWKTLSKKEAKLLQPLTSMSVRDSENTIFTLGKGNFGATYAGSNVETQEIYAIKEVRGSGAVEESLREGEIVHSLGDNLNIMPLIDYIHFKPEFDPYGGTHQESRLFQVMPLAYVNGAGFKWMLEYSRHDQREKVISDSFYQMMMGLDYIHKQGVVHMDIKADNTLYMKDGTLRIADFGRAIQVGDNDQIADMKSLGAMRIFSPEIIALIRKIKGGEWETVDSFSGKAADVWAAGLYIWELLEDDTENLFSTKSVPLHTRVVDHTYEYFEKSVENIGLLSGKYSSSLLNLLRQALTVDPETRIKTSQVIKLLSSSAMSPDQRKTAFEEVIRLSEVKPAAASSPSAPVYVPADPTQYIPRLNDQDVPRIPFPDTYNYLGGAMQQPQSKVDLSEIPYPGAPTQYMPKSRDQQPSSVYVPSNLYPDTMQQPQPKVYIPSDLYAKQ